MDFIPNDFQPASQTNDLFSASIISSDLLFDIEQNRSFKKTTTVVCESSSFLSRKRDVERKRSRERKKERKRKKECMCERERGKEREREREKERERRERKREKEKERKKEIECRRYRRLLLLHYFGQHGNHENIFFSFLVVSM